MNGTACTYRPLPLDIASSVITDLEFIAAIEAAKANGRRPQVPWHLRTATIWDLQNELGVRDSLIRRKARRTYRRGLTTGCICGCRGDFDTTPAGRALPEGAAAGGDR